MSRVLVLLIAWLLLSVPVALVLGRALRHGRAAAGDVDRYGAGSEGTRSGTGRRGSRVSRGPAPQSAPEPQGPFEPRLALVDPGSGRPTPTRAPSGDALT